MLALGAGCATVPSIPLTDIRAVEGKWRGTITVGMGAPQFYYLTVNPDSTIVAEWGPNWQCGALLYFDGSDGRVITMTPDSGGWYVYVTPLE